MILAVVVAVIVAGPFLVGGGLVVAAVLVPLAALAITGVLVWWLVSGEGPSGEPRDIALRAALGVGVLILSFAVAIGGAIAAAAGGEHRRRRAADRGRRGDRGRRVRAAGPLADPAGGAAGPVRGKRGRRGRDARRRGGRPPLPAHLDGGTPRPLPARARASWTSTCATSTCRRATRRSRSTSASAMCAWPCPRRVRGHRGRRGGGRGEGARTRQRRRGREPGGAPGGPAAASRLLVDAQIGVGATRGARLQRSAVQLPRLRPALRPRLRSPSSATRTPTPPAEEAPVRG